MMTASPSQLKVRPELAALLSEQPVLPIPTALALIRNLAQQLAELHAGGMLCGRITPPMIHLDDDLGPHLAPAAAGSFLALDGDWANLLPELARLEPLPLPATLDAAQNWLQAGGVTLDPRQIDLCQLGALWCRLLTGEAPGAYLRSPRVKGLVPAELRPLLERALGSGGSERFSDAQELVAALNAAAEQFAAPPTISGAEGPSAVPGPGIAPIPPRTSSDTTPSFVSSKDHPADTSIAGEHGAAARSENVATPAGEDPLPFARLGNYEIERRIGRGGMGDVYLGYEPALDRKVAIKVLPADMARSDEFVRRFRTEATAVARLNHPNIVPIYSIGEDQGHHFYVMQFVDGESLADLLLRREKLTSSETLPIVEQALSGLSAAHEQGMVHRDIKPGNILLDRRSGRALLADFGLVKSLESSATGKTATGVIMGTADYISPEQGRGQAVDHRSDLYSIGVLLFRMLSGKLPFTADSPTALIFQHVYEQPPELRTVVPDVPESLATVVARLLAKSPTDRHHSAEELLADLRAIRAGQPLPESDRARNRPSTTIIRLPAFDQEVPQIPADLAGLESPKWLDQVRGRALSMFRRHAPEVLQQLQNTQQQVDGAVAVYERRLRDLERLSNEAQIVLTDLKSQADDQRAAANVAGERAQAASNPDAAGQALEEQAACERAAVALDRQIAEQREQLEPIEVRRAQAQARVHELRTQRDILQARLKAAGAQRHVAGGGGPVRHRLRTIVGTATVAVVAGAVILSIRNWPGDKSSITPADPETKVVAPKSSVPEPSGTLTAVRLFPSLAEGDTSQMCLSFFDSGEFRISHIGGDEKVVHEAILPGTVGKCNVIATTLDGRRVALADANFSIHVWDIPERREFRQFEGHAKRINALCFSPDGSRLVSVSDGDVFVWDIQQDSVVKRFKLDTRLGGVVEIKWSAEGNRLLFGIPITGAPSLALFDLDAEKQTVEFKQTKTGNTDAVAFSTGEDVLSLHNNTIHVWDVRNGLETRRFGENIGKATFSANGAAVLTANKDGKITLWNARIGRRIKDLGVKGVAALAIAPDGSLAVGAATNGSIQVWKLPPLPTDDEVTTFDLESPVETIAFAPNGTLVAAGTNQAIRICVLEDPAASYSLDLESRVSAVTFSSKSDRLLYATGQPKVTNNRLGIKNIYPITQRRRPDGEFDVRRFRGNPGKFTAAAFSPDENSIISGSSDGSVVVWNVPKESEEQRIELGLPINSIAVSPSGKRLLIACDDNQIRRWDLEKNQEMARYEGHTLPVLSVVLSTDGFLAASGSVDRTIRVWDAANGISLKTMSGHTGRVNSVALSLDKRFILSGSEDHTVRLWNAATGTELRRFDGHRSAVRSVALSADGLRGASGSEDGTVRIWDLHRLPKSE